jgi:hypothetical protein
MMDVIIRVVKNALVKKLDTVAVSANVSTGKSNTAMSVLLKKRLSFDLKK